MARLLNRHDFIKPIYGILSESDSKQHSSDWEEDISDILRDKVSDWYLSIRADNTTDNFQCCINFHSKINAKGIGFGFSFSRKLTEEEAGEIIMKELGVLEAFMWGVGYLDATGISHPKKYMRGEPERSFN